MVYTTFRARRPLTIGEGTRQPGELVPEAETWFRVEHLVHAGHIVREVVDDNVFVAAVKEHCPDLEDILVRKAQTRTKKTAAAKA